LAYLSREKQAFPGRIKVIAQALAFYLAGTCGLRNDSPDRSASRPQLNVHHITKTTQTGGLLILVHLSREKQAFPGRIKVIAQALAFHLAGTCGLRNDSPDRSASRPQLNVHHITKTTQTGGLLILVYLSREKQAFPGRTKVIAQALAFYLAGTCGLRNDSPDRSASRPQLNVHHITKTTPCEGLPNGWLFYFAVSRNSFGVLPVYFLNTLEKYCTSRMPQWRAMVWICRRVVVSRWEAYCIRRLLT